MLISQTSKIASNHLLVALELFNVDNTNSYLDDSWIELQQLLNDFSPIFVDITSSS